MNVQHQFNPMAAASSSSFSRYNIDPFFILLIYHIFIIFFIIRNMTKLMVAWLTKNKRQQFDSMAAASSFSSSSSGVPTSRKGSTYDVFLSFRGPDTRFKFVGYLYEALQRAGIQTFNDDKRFGGGEHISEELVKAIKESRWAVVVFSKNYAESSWCLEELSNIMDCRDQLGQKVLPVFYHVDPCDVRWQKRDYATAFETHEDRFKGGDQMDKVNKWRKALTAAANLSGKHIVPDKDEVDFVKEIVQQISADIKPLGGSKESHLIGIQPRINTLISLLKMEATEEVLIVGICGMGGIGKTTLARALFKRIAHKFEGSSFVADVRENSSTKKDMCTLQERILNDILGERHGYKIKDRDQGAEIIRERCWSKKVLLFLDDVNDDEQLEYLAATREWFGAGSRIIITTRDQHLLSYADETYKPDILSIDQALELFSRNAFNRSSPPEGYEEFSIRAIHHAGGLPLALNVLGSHLRGRKAANVWESALKRLAKTQDNKIFTTLKLSFDDLAVSEKEIFLDIACFYKGRDKDDVIRILDSLDFETDIGICFLVEKSLIAISSNNRLDMHDLIQEMGRKVAQERSPNRRLWKLEQIHDLINKQELELVEGIVVPQYIWNQSVSADVFKSMKNLRVLDCDGKFTSCEPSFLPDELRWFRWRKYRFTSLPISHMSKLVGLEMERARIEHLWQGEKIMLQNLKFIHLKGCESLSRFPDVSGAPNIESLNLSFCKYMVEVDESVGSLKKLLYLDMRYCYGLKCLPSMLQMESLETLILIDCISLKRIPEFSPCMVNLSILDMHNCSKIEDVPSSIKYLSNLRDLNLHCCSSLRNIPNSIWELKCLNTLRLSYCKKLQTLPDDIQSMESMESLEELRIDSIHIHALTNSCYLRTLYLHGPLGDDYFPKNLHGLSSLKELHIVYNHKLIQLPESISHLSSQHLDISYCDRLQTLHGLPPGIQVLIVTNCNSLEKIEDLSKEYKCLNKIQISGCPKLQEEDEENGRYLEKMLDQSFLKKWAAIDGCLSIHIPGSNIPSWFKEQQDGCKIALKLPPNWQTEIIGFATCCVSRRMVVDLDIKWRFENDINETEEADETKEAGQYLWTCYIPYSLFEKFYDFEGEDRFHMTKGNLVFKISGDDSRDVVRCGAKFVYKEDVASIQETIPSISSFYWRWSLTNEFPNS